MGNREKAEPSCVGVVVATHYTLCTFIFVLVFPSSRNSRSSILGNQAHGRHLYDNKPRGSGIAPRTTGRRRLVVSQPFLANRCTQMPSLHNRQRPACKLLADKEQKQVPSARPQSCPSSCRHLVKDWQASKKKRKPSRTKKNTHKTILSLALFHNPS